MKREHERGRSGNRASGARHVILLGGLLPDDPSGKRRTAMHEHLNSLDRATYRASGDRRDIVVITISNVR